VRRSRRPRLPDRLARGRARARGGVEHRQLPVLLGHAPADRPRRRSLPGDDRRPGQFAAPAWVWILAFAVSGLGTGIAYRLLARRTATAPAQTATAPQQQAA